MADLFYVQYSVAGAPQRADFEFKEKAIAFADQLFRSGVGDVAVYDEFDPRDGQTVYTPTWPSKEIKFDKEHVGPILDAEKVLTVRLNLESDIQVDDQVRLVTDGGTLFALATIDKRSKMTARKFADKKLAGHKTYETVNRFLDEMGQYYPDQPLERNTRFDVVWFRDVIQCHK